MDGVKTFGMFRDDKREFPSPLVIGLITEFVGTAIMMFIGCGGTVFEFGMGPLIPAFTFAFSIMSALQILHADGPVHINPGVSLAFFVIQKMSWKRFLVYLVAQYLGAFAGYCLIYYLLPGDPGKLCLMDLQYNLHPAKGFAVEMFGSMILVLIVLGAVDAKNANLHDSLPLRISLGIAGIILCVAPLTGAGLNPARALAPAIILMEWNNHWIYEVAPFVGMAIGAVFYTYVLDDEQHYSLHSLLKRKFPSSDDDLV